jgi:hypothetical protein
MKDDKSGSESDDENHDLVKNDVCDEVILFPQAEWMSGSSRSQSS